MAAMWRQSWADTDSLEYLLHAKYYIPKVWSKLSELSLPAGKKKKKKICKSSKIVISRLSNAETSLKSSGRKKKKKRKWNPVTRIIWQDDSSLVKGIGTAVFSGFPAEYYCRCFISVVVVLSHFEPSNCQSWAPFSLQRRSYHSVSKQQSTLNN